MPVDGGHPPRCTFQGFAPADRYPTPDDALTLLPVDLTHSGHMDLLVGERRDDGIWTSERLANRGDGTFERVSNYGAAANAPTTMIAADFDGDGRSDLASVARNAPDIDLTQNDGVLGIDLGQAQGQPFASDLLTYAPLPTYGKLAAADFDGDGHPDLAFGGYNEIEGMGGATPDGRVSTPGPESSPAGLTVLRNSGHGTFGAPTVYPAAQAAFLAAGDFNGDGHVDLATLSGTLVVYFNDGRGSLAPAAPLSFTNGWELDGAAVADFDGDGRDDVVVATVLDPNAADEAIVVELYAGTAAGSFAAPITTALPNIPLVPEIVTGDFDGDGKPDIAMTIGNPTDGARTVPIPVLVFANTGGGTFAAPVIYPVAAQNGEYPQALAAGDFNGDGVTDLALVTNNDFLPYDAGVAVLLSVCP